MNQLRQCRECGEAFQHVSVGPGRPPVYCERHRTNKKNNAVKGYGPVVQVRKPSAAMGYGNDPKRTAQEEHFKLLIGYLGTINGKFASLCGDQTELNNEVELVKKILGIGVDQYVGFNYDNSVIRGNREKYPTGWWFDDDMCSDFGMNKMYQLGTQVIYYDACASLQGTSAESKKDRRNVSKLFLSMELKGVEVIMYNFWLEGRGRGSNDFEETERLLSTIDGSDQWNLLDYRDYQSGKTGRPWYRTLFLERK